jgi:ribosomal protein L35
MKKSFINRVKLTKTGSILRMAMGRGHNRSRKSQKLLQQKRKFKGIRGGININLLKSYLR